MEMAEIKIEDDRTTSSREISPWRDQITEVEPACWQIWARVVPHAPPPKMPMAGDRRGPETDSRGGLVSISMPP